MSCFLVVSESPISPHFLRGPAVYVQAPSITIAREVLRSITPSGALVSRRLDATAFRDLLAELARRGVPTVVLHPESPTRTARSMDAARTSSL